MEMPAENVPTPPDRSSLPDTHPATPATALLSTCRRGREQKPPPSPAPVPTHRSDQRRCHAYGDAAADVPATVTPPRTAFQGHPHAPGNTGTRRGDGARSVLGRAQGRSGDDDRQLCDPAARTGRGVPHRMPPWSSPAGAERRGIRLQHPWNGHLTARNAAQQSRAVARSCWPNRRGSSGERSWVSLRVGWCRSRGAARGRLLGRRRNGRRRSRPRPAHTAGARTPPALRPRQTTLPQREPTTRPWRGAAKSGMRVCRCVVPEHETTVTPRTPRRRRADVVPGHGARCPRRLRPPVCGRSRTGDIGPHAQR